jgi:hypothetical protein
MWAFKQRLVWLDDNLLPTLTRVIAKISAPELTEEHRQSKLQLPWANNALIPHLPNVDNIPIRHEPRFG